MLKVTLAPFSVAAKTDGARLSTMTTASKNENIRLFIIFSKIKNVGALPRPGRSPPDKCPMLWIGERSRTSAPSAANAPQAAARVVALPGTSEHQLGLAVDIVDANMQDLTDEQENTATQKWLMPNSWRYGFIHRYPNSKTDITGIIYEPWHYRYVGKDAAQDIFNRDITLEEYLGKAEH